MVFRLDDPQHLAVEVAVWLDLGQSRSPEPMNRVRHGWELAVSRPAVDRLEYLFALTWPDGAQAMVCDPANPDRVPTPFGDHSVIEFPGYRPPAWLAQPPVDATTSTLTVRARGLGRPLGITVWSPGPGPMPLLAVHDGPEFAQLGGMVQFVGALVGAGRLPPLRVALLAPGDRNRWYAASPTYATALTAVAVPALRRAVEVRGSIVLAGASLGALAALHAGCARPGTFGGLFLQSGSFLDADLDAHESDFAGFAAVRDFVSTVDGAPCAIAMTCGTGEENLANNRLMARRLGVDLIEVADAHTWTGWRDALDPALVDLLVRVWD